jgi:hypothetical protein
VEIGLLNQDDVYTLESLTRDSEQVFKGNIIYIQSWFTELFDFEEKNLLTIYQLIVTRSWMVPGVTFEYYRFDLLLLAMFKQSHTLPTIVF